MEIEIWKDIKGYDYLYQISNMGKVKSFSPNKKGKLLTPTLNYAGYPKVYLCKNGIHSICFIHRLIANAFIPNLDDKLEVNHIDGNKRNNSIDNLEWVTHRSNMQHAYRTGLILRPSGKEGYRSKCVNQYDSSKNLLRAWDCIAQAAENLNIDSSAIVKCCKRKLLESGGYIWRYADDDIDIDTENISRRDIKKVYQMDIDGNIVIQHDSIAEAVKYNNFPKNTQSDICKCCREKDRIKTVHGYKWKYAD